MVQSPVNAHLLPAPHNSFWNDLADQLVEWRDERGDDDDIRGLESEAEIERRIACVFLGEEPVDWAAFLAGFFASAGRFRDVFEVDLNDCVLLLYGCLGLDVAGFQAVLHSVAELPQFSFDESWKRPFHLARHALDQVILESGGEMTLDQAKATDPSRFLPAVVMLRDIVHGQWRAENPDLWEMWWTFRSSWDSVRSVASDHPIDGAFALATARPVTLNFSTGPGRDRVTLLASLAYHLQSRFPGQPIQLPVKLLGPYLYPRQHTPHRSAGRLLQLLERVGLLECTNPDYNYTASRARDFRFCLDRTDLYQKPTSTPMSPSPP